MISPTILTFNPSNPKTLPIIKQILKNLKRQIEWETHQKRSNLLTASDKHQP